MKRLLFALALTAIVTGLTSCGGSKSPTTSTPGDPSAPSIAGAVTDVVSGLAVPGVVVAIQGKSVTTGSDGRYSLTGLTAGQSSLTAQHQGHVNFSQPVTLASATTVNVGLTPSLAASGAGSWSGSWKNTTFSTTGGMTMQLSVDTIAQTMQLVLDVNGGVFGAGDPPAETFNGAYSDAGTTMTRTSTLLGTVTATITPTGQLTGSATSVPTPGISRVDFSGTVAARSIAISYTVTFTAGGTALGTATMTR
ncbi:MAG: carboxypeptidase regulatory-like domain-containing protein [Vicinamibacterales bacterium]